MTNEEKANIERKIRLIEFGKNIASIYGYGVSPYSDGIYLRKKNDLDGESGGYVYLKDQSFLLSIELQAKFGNPNWDRKNPTQDVIDAYSNLSDTQGQYSSKGYHSVIMDAGDYIFYHHDVLGDLEKITEFLGIFQSETFEGMMNRRLNNGE